MRPTRLIIILVLAAAALGLILVPSLVLPGGGGTTVGSVGQAGSTTVSSGTADLGGPFTLVDDQGEVVTEAAFEGEPTLLYFGFTYCPDVCPTALQKLGAAQDRMGEYGNDVQYVLVSVDPERDTPEQMATYVTNNGFPEGLRGFTGTVEQIDTIKMAYKVYAQKVTLEDSAMEYTVDHQDLVFLLGTDGKFVDFFTNRSTPSEIAARTRLYLTRGT